MKSCTALVDSSSTKNHTNKSVVDTENLESFAVSALNLGKCGVSRTHHTNAPSAQARAALVRSSAEQSGEPDCCAFAGLLLRILSYVTILWVYSR